MTRTEVVYTQYEERYRKPTEYNQDQVINMINSMNYDSRSNLKQWDEEMSKRDAGTYSNTVTSYTYIGIDISQAKIIHFQQTMSQKTYNNAYINIYKW